MLGIDALDIAVLLADTEMVEAALHDLMGRSQLMPMVEQNKKIKSLVRSQLNRWKKKASVKVKQAVQSEDLQSELSLYQEVIHWNERQFLSHIDDLMAKLEPISTFYLEANRLVNGSNARLNPMLPHFFCHQWYKCIIESVKQVQEETLEKEKQQQLDELYQRLEMLKQMDNLDTHQDTASIAGRLWDMTSVNLSKTDWSVMKSQADFLKKHPKLQEIAETLGRMAKQDPDPNEPLQYTQGIEFEEALSQQATDDIVGIHESNDLNKLLPNELLFLAYPELEVVFYKHLIDKRLMNYQMQGKVQSSRKVKAMEPHPAKAEEDTGPFIICVDASGSMRGFPEQCVKAMAFALMQIALAEDRECFVVLFSTDFVTYQLTKQDGLREASDFLSYTFHGGTDLEPAINAAIKKMQISEYQQADLVVLSDFIAPKQSKELIKQVDELKLKRNRFHAISLSKYGNPELMNIFDHHWAYMPNMTQRFIKQK